jgi:hypothetical protein
MANEWSEIWKEVIVAQSKLCEIIMDTKEKPHLSKPVKWSRFEASSCGIKVSGSWYKTMLDFERKCLSAAFSLLD